MYVISNGTEYMLGSGLTNSDWTVTKNGARVVTSWASLSGMAAAGNPEWDRVLRAEPRCNR